MIETDTGTDELLCPIENRVGVITLNKSHNKNALGRMKINLNQGMGQRVCDGVILEAEHLVASMGDAEGREAFAAFIEKPSPSFHEPVEDKEP